jgi:ribosome maturation protein SDO1
VLEYRNGAETDLDNVLQIPNVFLNVSKGQVASAEDLSKAFGKDKKLDDIILEILKKGELQVGDKERHAQLDRIHNEVIDIVAGKLVDPKTKRPYTTGMIDKALDQLSSSQINLSRATVSLQLRRLLLRAKRKRNLLRRRRLYQYGLA